MDFFKLILESVLLPLTVSGLASSFAWGQFIGSAKMRIKELEKWKEEHSDMSKERDISMSQINSVLAGQVVTNRTMNESLARIESRFDRFEEMVRQDVRNVAKDLGERIDRIDRRRHVGHE